MKIKIAVLVMALAVLVVSLSGCSKNTASGGNTDTVLSDPAADIRGSWVLADGSPTAVQGYPDRLELKDNGVLVIEGYDGTYTVANGRLSINATGRFDYFGYSLDGGILTLTHTGLDTAEVKYKRA